MSTALSWFVVPEAVPREIHNISRDVADWSGREAATRMHAVLSRSAMAARGEKIEWNGRLIDPRYHYKNQTIIDLLEITPSEERYMDVIISSDEARRRHRTKERERKHRTGEVKMSRSEYTAAADRDRVRAAELRVQGLTQSQIADALGCSQQRVSKLLKGIDKGILRSVRLYGGETSPKGGI